MSIDEHGLAQPVTVRLIHAPFVKPSDGAGNYTVCVEAGRTLPLQLPILIHQLPHAPQRIAQEVFSAIGAVFRHPLDSRQR